MMRLGFIKKVYGVVTLQLLVTFAFVIFTFNKSLEPFFINLPLVIIAIVGSLVTVIMLSCSRNLARQTPNNYIILGVFTVCESYLVAFISAQYSPEIVITAIGLTTLVCVGLTAYACTTKTDFTFLGAFLVVTLLLLIMFGILLIFIPSSTAYLIYCCLGVLLFSIYLIYDTQLVMGKYGLEYQIDDYIIAALNIYLDIINIFIYILRILGKR